MLRLFSAALVFAGACSVSFAAADSTLLSMAPAGSQMIVALDVENSRSSAFGQFLLRQLGAQENSFQQLMNATGFDPRRDLQSVLFVATPAFNTGEQGQFAVLARGVFDQSRIRDAAQKNGSVVQNFQGVDLFVDNHHGGQTAFAFPDTGLAVMGDAGSVKQILSNRANPTTLDSGLQEQISKIESQNIWFASIVPPTSLAAHLHKGATPSAQQSQVLQSVIRSSGGVTLGSSAQVMLNAVTRSAQDATALADVIRFMASMVQMQGRNNNASTAALASALDGMRLDTAGEAVNVSLQLPESALEQFAASGAATSRTPR